MTLILGIDPGNTGALAFWDGRHLSVHDMPTVTQTVGKARKTRLDISQLNRIIEEEPAHITAFVEAVHAMPKQGVSSSFNFGYTYGAILGVLVAQKIPSHHLRPQEWMREAAVPGKRGDKGVTRKRAAEIFPAYADLFARAKDDGRADAALIAWAGHRKLSGMEPDAL